MAAGLEAITERRRPLQTSIIYMIGGVCTRLWPGAVVEAYGSYATKLSTPSSDIDLLVRNVAPTPHDAILTGERGGTLRAAIASAATSTMGRI